MEAMRQTAGSRIRCALVTLALAVMLTTEVRAVPVAAKAPVQKYLSRWCDRVSRQTPPPSAIRADCGRREAGAARVRARADRGVGVDARELIVGGSAVAAAVALLVTVIATIERRSPHRPAPQS
jgi:hypothetical protein